MRFLKNHIAMTATGSFDLIGSKLLLNSLSQEPSLRAQKEILVDLRDVDCTMSTFDVYELAQHLAFPNPALDTNKKIAVLITGNKHFNHAQFFDLCGLKKSVNIRAFEQFEAADRWLHGDSSRKPKERA